MAVDEPSNPESASNRPDSDSQAVLARLSKVEQELFNANIRLQLAEIFLGGRTLTVQRIGPPFHPFAGFGWTFELAALRDLASSVSAPHQSSLVICEDGKPLGPGNALHDDIQNIGLGQYSHWGDFLIFSTSDNTDPNHNGRRYDIVFPQDQAS